MGDGNATMVAVAQSQLGNVGGEPYWRWWGLDYRVEWCAIFVSWCADQCGYLDAGLADHVGIVEKCEDGRGYTIEGNSNDACLQNRYYVGSRSIFGYGLPAY